MLERQTRKQDLPRILAVDDDEVKAYALQRTLEASGFSVETVHSGKAALQAALSRRFHVMLLDVHLPDMNGFEVCAAIRSDKTLEQPIVIFHSATDPTPTSIERSRAVGSNAFLAHPIDRQALVALLLYFNQNESNTTALLGTWKEIANFFGKGVRTVQRWERERGMPVYRPGDGSGLVIADPVQLRRWATHAPSDPENSGE